MSYRTTQKLKKYVIMLSYTNMYVTQYLHDKSVYKCYEFYEYTFYIFIKLIMC